VGFFCHICDSTERLGHHCLHRILAEHVHEAGALGVGLQGVDCFVQAQLSSFVEDGPRLSALAEDFLGRSGFRGGS